MNFTGWLRPDPQASLLIWLPRWQLSETPTLALALATILATTLALALELVWWVVWQEWEEWLVALVVV